jgi:hypothetical protein
VDRARERLLDEPGEATRGHARDDRIAGHDAAASGSLVRSQPLRLGMRHLQPTAKLLDEAAHAVARAGWKARDEPRRRTKPDQPQLAKDATPAKVPIVTVRRRRRVGVERRLEDHLGHAPAATRTTAPAGAHDDALADELQASPQLGERRDLALVLVADGQEPEQIAQGGYTPRTQ